MFGRGPCGMTRYKQHFYLATSGQLKDIDERNTRVAGHKLQFGPKFSYTFFIELILAPIESGPFKVNCLETPYRT